HGRHTRGGARAPAPHNRAVRADHPFQLFRFRPFPSPTVVGVGGRAGLGEARVSRPRARPPYRARMSSVHPPTWFTSATATPARSTEVDVEGCPIHALSWGDTAKPGLVLVHGGAAHAHWWDFIAPQLTHHYHVAAVDLSGHGDSGHRDGYAMEQWAREVLEV